MAEPRLSSADIHWVTAPAEPLTTWRDWRRADRRMRDNLAAVDRCLSAWAGARAEDRGRRSPARRAADAAPAGRDGDVAGTEAYVVTRHKRSCANCRRPPGQLTARLWFPPLKVGESVPGPDWSVCCWNPIGCGCVS